MKKSILPLLMLGLGYTVRGQPTFEKFYRSATSYSFDLIELPGQSLLTCMSATHLLNSDGFIEHSSFYHSGGTYFTQTLKSAGPNTFYFTTATIATQCSFGSQSLVYPVLGKMDSLGSTASVRRYELNSGFCIGLPGGLEVTSGLGAITWGRDKNFFALRIDSGFEPVWAKRVSRNGGFQFIKELPGGDLLADINMDTAGAVIARLDAQGNFIWSKSYIRPKGIVHDALILSDDSFIITGCTDSTTLSVFVPLPASYQPKLFMMKLNGEGEVQWCRGYDSAPNYWKASVRSRIEPTLDSNFVLLATMGLNNYNSYFRPLLLKTDLNGDTLWTSSIGRDGYSYITQDLVPISDGGIMFSGIIYGDLPNGNSGLEYIFNSDSMGHFPCWERDHAVQVLDLFPTDSSFILVAEDVIATATEVFVTDSILDTSLFTVYDSCTFTTGMPPRVRQDQKLSVRPNPNTGRFTVEFQDPLMAESYYSVFDATGRLLYQRPLPAGATLEEIDLSRFGRGTYLLRVTDPEGQRHERVLLE